jgi:ATP adenylyltransferase
MSEMATIRRPVLRAIRRTIAPEGFNLGLNVGSTAGAGIADHLHEHVVPRWLGDANFMPILASTMVMPELIPVTYAKIRAELAAELASGSRDTTLAIVGGRTHMLVDAAGRLPEIVPREGESIWAAAMRDARERGATDAELLGWAGERTVGPGQSALLLRATIPEGTELAAGSHFSPVNELRTGNDAQFVRNALQHENHFGSC